jgi:hypothetical protein
MTLAREDWDFSDLPKCELRAALSWEIRRECPDVEEIVTKAKLWLDGRLSSRKPPLSVAQRKAWRGRNPKFSEAEKASLQARAVFDDFVPTHEFHFLHKWNSAQRRAEFDRWEMNYLRPLVFNWRLPWLRLSSNERGRLCSILENSRSANVVSVGSWWDAVGTFERRKIDPGLPLKFHYSDYTTILLTINWRLSKKRILCAIGKILSESSPANVVKWNARGRKNRDMLVMLERIGIMRLLHHYTLSEIRLKLPDAWRLYQGKKWYDERRQALKDFRRKSPYAEPEIFFPASWQTKAKRKASALPTK